MSNDLEQLMAAISPDAPSGADLEYDPDFSRMEKAAQGTPDQEFGSTKIEGTPADWDEVRDAALSILSRSQDLRAATYLAEAELNLSGVIGFRNAMKVIAAYVEQFWETVYPRLDEDDDNDPTIRINALAGLSKIGGLIRQIRVTPILSSRSVGRFSWTDCAIAKGEVPVPAGMDSPPTQKQIDAAVLTSDAKEFTNTVQAVDECIALVKSIEAAFSDRLGAATGPNLEPLSKELKAIARFQKMWVAVRNEANGNETTGIVAESAMVTTAIATVDPTVHAHATNVQPIRGPWTITRREDVIEGLDKIISWLERNEPSSPLPMLLKRAKRLSTMSFMDILRDISPDGLSQALLIGGPEAESSETEEASSASDHESSRPRDHMDGY